MDDLIEKMGDDEAPLDIKYVLNLHFPSPSNQDQLLSILHLFSEPMLIMHISSTDIKLQNVHPNKHTYTSSDHKYKSM